jgi:hypothetical protein
MHHVPQQHKCDEPYGKGQVARAIVAGSEGEEWGRSEGQNLGKTIVLSIDLCICIIYLKPTWENM